MALVPHESLPAGHDPRRPLLGGPATERRLSPFFRPEGITTVEGPRWYVDLAPGVFALRTSDPARAQRAHERAVVNSRATVDLLVAEGDEDGPKRVTSRPSKVTEWSRKSRANMTRRLASLDYAAALEAAPEGWALGMLTVTYPGDWLTVAPSAAACSRHLATFRRRFERRWGPLRAVWKREFQRRGAPHFHLGGLLPTDPGFITWVSFTWADVVAHPDADERAAHRAAGTAVDYARGSAATDPRRFAGYFAKHGIFSAKEYQNTAPAEWPADEGVGRFWGYWRLEPLVLSAEVAPDVARLLARTTRRWVASRGVRMRVYRWRKVTTVDRETGEVGWKWRRRATSVPLTRFRGSSGFLVHSDAPGLLTAVSRAAAGATTVRVTPAGRVGAAGLGPVGFLP